MELRNVQSRKARPGIEVLELRIAPTIVAVNGGGNTPNGEARPQGQQAEVYVLVHDVRTAD